MLSVGGGLTTNRKKFITEPSARTGPRSVELPGFWPRTMRVYRQVSLGFVR